MLTAAFIASFVNIIHSMKKLCNGWQADVFFTKNLCDEWSMKGNLKPESWKGSLDVNILTKTWSHHWSLQKQPIVLLPAAVPNLEAITKWK